MEKRVILWGAGRFLYHRKKYVRWEEVLCIVDSDATKQGTYMEGVEIVSPVRLLELEYDKVVMFLSVFQDAVYTKLTEELGVPKQKIYNWNEYLEFYSVQPLKQKLLTDAAERGCKRIWDWENTFYRHHVYTYPSEQVRVEPNELESGYGIYDTAYAQTRIVQKKEQGIFLGKIQEWKKEWYTWLSCYQVIYFTAAYMDAAAVEGELAASVGEKRSWLKYNLTYERLYAVTERTGQAELKIYIAAHKAFQPPTESVYIPLWLGKPEENKWNYKEHTGNPNIASLNPLINECTGLFWIWKHASTDYVGLVHYRRYFLNDAEGDRRNILKKEKALELLERYDVITAPLLHFEYSLLRQLKDTTDEAAVSQGMELVEKIIAKKQPEYVEAFHYVFAGNAMFPCNMFITSKQSFDSYCEWLFSIIIEAAQEVDVSAYDAYSKRIIGFLAERLFTVWLVKQKLSIKELPYILTE